MPFIDADINIVRPYRVEGRAAPPDNELPVTSLTVASADYFEALRIPLLQGRPFSAADHADAPPIAIINDLMAERLWPGEDPIGQRITANWPEGWRTTEVVGVVGAYGTTASKAIRVSRSFCRTRKFRSAR